MTFWLALTVFLGSHMLIARPPVRGLCVRAVGERVYLILYSLLSLFLLGWVIVAAQDTPRTEWWDEPALRWAPNLLMPVACMLMGMGFAVANPLSVGRPGLALPRPLPFTLALTRHPVLWAFLLWAAAHLAANGEYPLAVLFGVMLALAVGGLVLVDRKKRRQLGAEAWRTLAAGTSAGLFSSAALWTGRFKIGKADLVGAAVGFLLYAALFHMHAWLFNASPLP